MCSQIYWKLSAAPPGGDENQKHIKHRVRNTTHRKKKKGMKNVPIIISKYTLNISAEMPSD